MSKVELTYENNYIPMNREELVAAVQKSVQGPRFDHILRVEQKAIELAKQNDADVEKASIAALLHDYAKNRPDSEFIDYINKLQLDPILLDYGNAI